jgi:Na+/H+ antiporter NhaD/arsenite permease-like protein
MNLTYFSILCVFVLGYAGIIFEYGLKINKTAVALVTAVTCWAIYFFSHAQPLSADLTQLGVYISDISQILFFLLGSMTLVELVDAHKGFKIVTDIIHTKSKRKMLWVIALITFVLSAILDNLTTTILMISLLRKLIPDRQDRLSYSCMIVVAANSGGAWTPIGDVTTTMLWINGQLSTLAVMKSLFLPSVISLLVPLAFFTTRLKGKFTRSNEDALNAEQEPGARLVFYLGTGGLIFVPIFKALTGLPPFMGVLIVLGILWLVTDLMHHQHESRNHLKVPHILTKIDTAGILFFLGILLCVNALEVIGSLHHMAEWLNQEVRNLPLIATLIGLISAVIDNVPLVAATMGMYSLTDFPMDHSFWHMIAYAAGTGGSILLIGSSSGVALMGLEKIDFFTYLKKMTLPVLAGYLAGMGIYLLFS